MCGIFGFQGDYDPSLLSEAQKVLAHRGPDGRGLWFDPSNRLGLTHTRLAIIDLSITGHQPMWDTQNQIIITFNGEIYNYCELRQELLEAGCNFAGNSDTEVILNLYRLKGLEMLPRLNGIFAFALWDTHKRSLLIARDGLGVKPLYYSQSTRGFLWSSEIKALLLEASVKRDLDIVAIYHYLSFLWCPAPSTPLTSVKKLEPGNALLVKNGKIENKWSFYKLPYHLPRTAWSQPQAEALVRDTIQKAVTRQMVADVPVGSFLSGGLDSTSVVAFAKQACHPQRLQCFTIGFQEGDRNQDSNVDDLPYAKLAAKELGVDLHVVEVGSEMADLLETMIYFLDEPQADPAPINALLISRLARQHGIKVLLSGAGGDDIFTGYRRHIAINLERIWAWMPSLARKALASAARKLPSENSTLRRVGKALKYASLEGDERIASYFLWASNQQILQAFHPDLSNWLTGQRQCGPLLDSLMDLPPSTPALNKMLFLDSKHFLTDHNLNYTDKMGMANGVEVRVPLLDPEVVELAARLPLSLKLKGREGKWIFKKAMEPLLPREVIYRSKSGFGVPLRYWMKRKLKPLLDDILSEESLKRRGLFSYSGVHRLRRANDLGRVDATYTIFGLVCMELWCRIFLDQPNPLSCRPFWPNNQ
jgi:asparagine synthase (glutamine-hydrolysing)